MCAIGKSLEVVIILDKKDENIMCKIRIINSKVTKYILNLKIPNKSLRNDKLMKE